MADAIVATQPRSAAAQSGFAAAWALAALSCQTSFVTLTVLAAALVRTRRSARRADGVLQPPISSCVFRAQGFSNAYGEASGEPSFVAESNAQQNSVFFAGGSKNQLARCKALA